MAKQANKAPSKAVVPKKDVKAKNGQKTAKHNPIKNLPKSGPKFSKDNQPAPEAKKMGWQKLREQRLLTQNILKAIFKNDGQLTVDGKDLFKSLIVNAKKGNPKALDLISKAIEDDVQKISITDSEGKALPQVILQGVIPTNGRSD